MSDRRCLSIHGYGEAGHDRLRNRVPDNMGRSAGADSRQPACGEARSTRIPSALEASISCLIGWALGPVSLASLSADSGLSSICYEQITLLVRRRLERLRIVFEQRWGC